MLLQLCRLCEDLWPTITHTNWTLWCACSSRVSAKKTPFLELARPEYAAGAAASRAALLRSCPGGQKATLTGFSFVLLLVCPHLFISRIVPFPPKPLPRKKLAWKMSNHYACCWMKLLSKIYQWVLMKSRCSKEVRESFRDRSS